MQQEGFVWFATLPSRFNRTLEAIAQTALIHHLSSDKRKKTGIRK